MARIVALLLLLGASAFADPKPTRAALRKVFELNQHRVVGVRGPKAAGAGIIVGAQGQVLTSVDFVSLHEAQVQHAGRTLNGKVVFANGRLSVAMVAITAPGEYPSAASAKGELQRGQWVLGISRSKKGVLTAHYGRIRSSEDKRKRVRAGLPLPKGSPVFDMRGGLVGISVAQRRGECDILPLSAVRPELVSAVE